MKKLKVGVDLDDVLMSFNAALCVYHNRIHGTSYTREDIRDWKLHELWDCSSDVAKLRIEDFYNSDEHAAADPIHGALAAVQRLQESFELLVVTARSERERWVTETWMRRHFPQLVDKVHYTNYHGAHPHLTKASVCEREQVQILVDDATHNAASVAPVAKVLLFDAPWNRSYVPTHTNIRRVYSWEHACAAIESALL